MKNILIEIAVKTAHQISGVMEELGRSKLMEVDLTYKPVLIKRKETGAMETYIIKGRADEANTGAIEKLPFVIKVWNDFKIAHFACGCNPAKKGTVADVAECIGAGQLWKKGFQGAGIVIGIVDMGVDKTKFPVINGSSPNWGTISPGADPGLLHGNMTTTDALAIAPSAKIYDLNYTDSSGTIYGVISKALQAFNWAIQQFDIDGTPHILSNSWGIYQKSWDAAYATDPNHPFTVKVKEAIDKGIKVLFSAGNCGNPCNTCACGGDTGGGKDIWGANGLSEVMTVGAVKLNNKRLKYSSQGPAALSDKKPDFCGYSQFKGYYDGINKMPDSGTSASCPVIAGGVALLLSYKPGLTQAQIKELFQTTAKDIEGTGFDHNTGYGIVRLDNAYYELEPAQKPAKDFRDKLCSFVYSIERKCVSQADEGYSECAQLVDEGTNTCTQWADEGSNHCCTWWPCSKLCKVLYWIAKMVCKAWHWVSNMVCKAWHWVTRWVCKLFIWVITAITLTNCKCR